VYGGSNTAPPDDLHVSEHIHSNVASGFSRTMDVRLKADATLYGRGVTAAAAGGAGTSVTTV
jgi:hypothetical protein